MAKMKLSLSGRIGEHSHIKDKTAIGFEDLAQLASEIGYEALCIRPSQATVDTADEEIRHMRQILDRYNLQASMVLLGGAVAANTADSGQSLRAFDRQLDVTDMLGARMIRVGVNSEEDVRWAQQAADQARERGVSLVHFTHSFSPFETVDQCLEMMARINRPNFGLAVEPANLLQCALRDCMPRLFLSNHRYKDYGPEAMRRLGPHVFSVQVQNLRLTKEGSYSIQTHSGTVHYERLIVGEQGGIDFDRFFKGLNAIDFDGFVTSHQPAMEGMSVRELAQTVFDGIGKYRFQSP